MDNSRTEDRAAALAAVKTAADVIEEKFGKDITVLDIAGVSIMADYFVIATASQKTQLKALADAVDRALFAAGLRLRHTEGEPASGWILMDFGSAIVHLFTGEQRELYDLERMWADGEVVMENGEWK